MNYYFPDTLQTWSARILEREGVPHSDAAVTARYLVRSDLRGYTTHGLARLASYVEHIRQGNIVARPDITFERRGTAWTVGANGGLGQVVADRVLEAALPFMATRPMLWVAVRESSHMGALGIFALAAAEAGLVCLMGQRTPPLLAMPGFSRAAIGHNPFAFGCPTGPGRPPVVVDMACSVAARGHILLAARDGTPIPAQWALDAAGEPTTDASAALVGMLQPAGGYKGMALAMIFECLSGALSSTAESNERVVMQVPLRGAVPRQSGFFMLLNPALICQDEEAFAGYMAHWVDHYRQSGAEHAHVPGDRGDLAEKRARHMGITYSPALEAELQNLATQYGLPLAVERR